MLRTKTRAACAALVLAATALGGCAYYGPPPAYRAAPGYYSGYYYNAPSYYYAPPAYYGPPVYGGLEFNFGGGGWRHWR